MKILFFIYLFLLLCPVVVYPASIALLALFKRQASATEAKKTIHNDSWYPTVSLITVARNEEKIIEQKIQNFLELDYPADKKEIIICDDASDDQTPAIIRNYESSNITLLQDYHKQ